MHFFSDTVLWKDVDMEPEDIIFKPDGGVEGGGHFGLFCS